MGWSTGTCDQVWSKSVKSCRRYKTLKCWQKKKKKEIVQKKYTVADCDCVIIVRRKKERKKLDMRPLPRARVKLGGWMRSPCFWWKRPFDPYDLKSKFEPISFEEGSTWCMYMSFTDKVHNIEEIMHFSENQGLTPVTPNGPRLTYDPIT